jgi:predicted ATPase
VIYQTALLGQQYEIALLAQNYARVGLAHIERTGATLYQPEMQRLKGEMLLIRDRRVTDQAEACFRTGLDIAHEQDAKWWELRTTVSLARLLRDTDRRDEARKMLRKIYNWFTEGFDLPDLKEAKTLLDELRAG